MFKRGGINLFCPEVNISKNRNSWILSYFQHKGDLEFLKRITMSRFFIIPHDSGEKHYIFHSFLIFVAVVEIN